MYVCISSTSYLSNCDRRITGEIPSEDVCLEFKNSPRLFTYNLELPLLGDFYRFSVDSGCEKGKDEQREKTQ